MKLLIILCIYLTLLHLLLAIAAAVIYYSTRKETLPVAPTNLPTVVHRRIKLDAEFSQVQKYEIIFALNQWKKSLCGLFDFSIVDSNFNLITDDDQIDTIIFLRAENKDKLIKTIDFVERANIYGFAYYSQEKPAVILLVPERINNLHDFKNIALHEIGHVLGISHISDEVAVMSKYYSGIDKITYSDLVAFFSVCYWDQKSMKYANDPFWNQVDIKQGKSKQEKYHKMLNTIN